MLGRYSGAIGAGAVVTAALIYGMQQLIHGEESYVPPDPPPLRLAPPVLPELPPPPPPRITLPDPPRPPSGPPDTRVTIPNPTTDPDVPVGPVTPTGPPVPPARPGGRSGPWATDSEAVLVARARPPYPYDAKVKGLEGYVVVEFTVTRRGEVDDVSIVESTHREFERAAAMAVAKARYRPRVVDGLAVDAPGQRTRIAFVLDD